MNDCVQPVVKQQMLIRVPANKAFEAFVDAQITTKFWFTHSSGRLDAGTEVTWEWRMYGCSTRVNVLEVVPERLLKIEWGDDGRRSSVTWNFEPRTDDTTMVVITNQGFFGSQDEQVSEAIDSMGGFSLVLAAAKAWLEHGIQLGVVNDKAPEAHVDGWNDES